MSGDGQRRGKLPSKYSAEEGYLCASSGTACRFWRQCTLARSVPSVLGGGLARGILVD